MKTREKIIVSIPFLKKQHLLKSGLSIILFCLLSLCISETSSAQWSAYFPGNDPLILPITAPDEEKPQWKLAVGKDYHLYAVNFKTGQLVIFNQSRNQECLIQLPLPVDALTKSGCIWVLGDRIYLKGSEDNQLWIYNSQGVFLQKLNLQCAPGRYYNFTGITVDPRGYIYLLDAQSLEIITFDCNGKYEGIFGKKGDRFNNLPALPECFCLDNEGIFYFAVHNAVSGESRIVKFSYQGRFDTAFTGTVTGYHYRNLWVDSFQNLYATVPENSMVIKFDSRGQEICQFHAENSGSLAVNNEGIIFTASSKGNIINQFLPAQTIRLIDLGNRALHDDDNPDRAESYLKQALILNNQLPYIHSILGEVYFHQRRFWKAMEEFKYLRDHWRYSQSLASFRYDFLIHYGIICGILLVSLIILGFQILPHFHPLWRDWPPIKILLYPRSFLTNSQQILTPAIAWSFVLILAISYYFSWYCTNQIFIGGRQVFSLKIFCCDLAVILILAWIGSGVAYKVGELFQGMATYPALSAGIAVSVFPMMIGFPVLALISHILTYNELWVYQCLNYLLIFWVTALFWMTLKVSEDFSWDKALGVGLLNLAATGLVLLFVVFLIGLNRQLISFCYDLIYEIYTRLAG